VPNDYELLTRLPGVGDYTASAVLAFAFGRRSVVLDTNIRRVLARAWHGEQFPTSQVSVAERAFADSLTPQSDKRAAMWSAAVMELGAVICTARSPLCAECPIKTECVWLAAGYPESQVPRRTQAFKGTDRQMRGRMMEALRSNHGSMAEKDLLALCPEREQADRVLKSLITDGLAVKVRANRYRLPD
jgi:A/G-specific adenine glycosylase